MKIKSRFLASSVSSKEVADKLTAFLDKKGVDLAPKEFDETVEYIRSLFDDEWAALTAKSGIRNLDEAIRAWYNDTKLNYPESFIRQSKKEHLSSIANSHKQIKSDYLVELTAIGPDGNYSEKSYLGLGDFVEGDVLGYDVAEECSPMSKDEAESLAKDVEYDLKNRNIKDVKVKVIESARKPRFGKAVKSSVENDIRKKFHDEMIDVIWNITEKYNSYGIPEFPREDDFQEILDECKRNAMW